MPIKALMFIVIVALFLVMNVGAGNRRASPGGLSEGTSRFETLSFVSTAKKPDFETEIKPIFQARCQPCHFQGGKVYDQMPFDRPETINTLGEKLFTRIKDKEEQRLIREFLTKP